MTLSPPCSCDAFITPFDSPLNLPAAQTGSPLAGLRMAVKDNFDVAGTVTGAGNPEYAADHSPAIQHAAIVERLLGLGVQIVGKTHMDELAFSLMGLNARYGTPVNPAAPDRVPGGSSSGSASAVAAGLADIGLGTDTGGSVRLPASFCGLFGWRPSHGMLPASGMVPLAASYDVPGFFTRELALMQRLIGLLASPVSIPGTLRFWLPEDLWALAEPATAKALRAALPGQSDSTAAILPAGGAAACLTAFRHHQGHEIWEHFGAWISQRSPDFGPGIHERFEMTRHIDGAQFATAADYRDRLVRHLKAQMAEDVVLVYPTAPAPAPLLSTPQSELEPFRNRALSMLAVAGHAGLPQLTIPLTRIDSAPVGLSFVTTRNQDGLLPYAAKAFLRCPI